ncbi:type I polyketide synthase [Streptomyces pactum]|uniref:Type I polyketide synthase n=1 Tax=Streptomyces pactum TaxID=68249 RepID=A0A1S6J5N5_9ACTN|nr:type I polyketide synthase [Streptomyces pactum]AQS67079.1 type I polyketide synthase [Streptomyces pactum]
MEEADDSQELGTDIAVIGMAGRFPGAPDLDRFWSNLRDGVESVSFFDDAELLAVGVPEAEFSRPGYVKAGARAEGVDLFDAEFFGYTPREATIMDPQHRIFLELAWEALEHSGYSPGRIGDSVGVFGGAGTSAYLPHVFANLESGASIGASNVGLGNELGFLTTRVSYKLDLHGPSIPVHTACSSSLVAVHLACQSLLNHECGMAIAGGVAFKVPPGKGYRYQESGILSPDGHCRPFDADSRGTVFNNGAGIVVLKRLDDALRANDTVYAVIKGTAVNNDGSAKASFTAPGVAGQSAVVLEALEIAGVEAGDISYVEAHGSGTRIGDSIEIEALTRAFGAGSDRVGRCAIGSVKSNVGHLDAAAGIAGLLKTTLALGNRTLPPTVHFRQDNPAIDFPSTPFYVQRELAPWNTPDGGPRRAGVSAFGFGGTNAHVVLEEAPEPAPPGPARPSQVLVLSARTPQALERVSDRLAARLRQEDLSLADVAFTLAQGRQEFRHRRVVVAPDPRSAARALEMRDGGSMTTGTADAASPSVAFLFTGQGSAYPGMAAGLYAHEAVFRAAVDRCAELLRPELGTDVRDLLLAAPDDEEAARRLGTTALAQPALFTLEHALAELWNAWGVTPSAMIGHSLGEYVAACRAGVFELADALRLVALRGRLMERQAGGAMLSVATDRATVERLLPAGLSLAAHNGPSDCVVSGPHEAIAAFAALAERQGIATRPVATPHAFHCALMAPMVEEFTRAVAQVPRHEPAVPFLSNVTGDWITTREATDPAYWGRHVLATVEFARGVEVLAADPDVAFLEVGPGQTLRSLAARNLAGAQPPRLVTATLPHRQDSRGPLETAQRALGLLWLHGITPDWTAYQADERPRRVALPTYPFERTRHWLEPVSAPRAPLTPGPHPLLDEMLVRTVDEAVFRTSFDLERHWVLSEHKMLSEAIVPGTTYLEMARAAGTDYLGEQVTVLSDVEFQVPLLVTARQPRVAHTIVRSDGDDGAAFKVVSQDPAAPEGRRWTVHVRGRLSAGPRPPRHADLPALAARCRLATVDVGTLQAEHRVMDFGGRWQDSLRSVDVGVRAALGHLNLPERYHEETGAFALHPALLDLATGFHRWAMLQGDDGAADASGHDFYLPLAYDHLTVHGPMPAQCVSFVQPDPDFPQSDEIRKVDVLVCAPDGAVVLDVKGFTAKRVHDPRRTVHNARGASAHHILRWVPAARTEAAGDPAGAAGAARRPVDRVLVVGADSPRRAAVVAELRDADVTVDVTGADTDWTTWTEPLPPETVFVASEDEAGSPGRDAQERLLDSGVMALLSLAQTLGRQSTGPRRLTVVAGHVETVTGDEPYVVPAHSALFGLAKVIGQEHPDVRCRCVDTAAGVPPGTLAREILGTDPAGQVALRSEGRYVLELVEADLGPEPEDTPAVPDGVHLITGGLGGLGLEVARSIGAARPGARIALVGRSGLPPREQWPDVLRDGPAGQAGRIRLIQEMESHGARVLVCAGDVSDHDDMARVLATVRRDLGRVTWLIHAAGTAGDGFLMNKTPDTYRATLAPKVMGAMVLDEVTADDPPELMVMFSSTTALFGSPGQGDYTAANLFLDAYAAWRGQRGLRTITLNWTDWLGTGMAADHGVQRDQGFFRSVEIEDALASFHAAVRSNHGQVIVGEINHDALAVLDPAVLRARMAASPIRLGEPIRRAVSARSAASATRAAAGSRASVPDVTLLGRPDGAYSPMEETLGRLWAAEFGIREIDVSATFLDLGGDSLLALRLSNNLQEALDVKTSIADLFAHPTVADLARHLTADDEAADQAQDPDPAAVPDSVTTPGTEPTTTTATDSGRAAADETDPAWFGLWNAQSGMWVQHQLGEGRAELNLPVWTHVHRAVDPEVFRRAVAYLIDRHQALRLVFRDTADGPRQRVLPAFDLDVPLIDLSAHPDPEAEAERLIRADSAVPFDDLGTPPLRAALYRLGSEHHCVHYTMHHLISDGTGIGIFLRELLETYEALAQGREPSPEPLESTYEELIRGRFAWLAGPERPAAEAYWLGELAGPLPRLHIGDYDAPGAEVSNETVDFTVDPDLSEAVAALAGKWDVTVHVLLLSAYAAALRGIGSDDDMVICVPFSGRDSKSMGNQMGMFVNPLAVRLALCDTDTFEELVRRAQRKSVGAYAHSRYPFTLIAEQVAPADGTPRIGRNPVFSTAFQFTDFLPPANQTSQLDICLYGKPGEDGLSMRLTYNSLRLTESEALEVRAAFLAALREVTAEPGTTLAALAGPMRRALRAGGVAPRGRRRLGAPRSTRAPGA